MRNGSQDVGIIVGHSQPKFIGIRSPGADPADFPHQIVEPPAGRAKVLAGPGLRVEVVVLRQGIQRRGCIDALHFSVDAVTDPFERPVIGANVDEIRPAGQGGEISAVRLIQRSSRLRIIIKQTFKDIAK